MIIRGSFKHADTFLTENKTIKENRNRAGNKYFSTSPLAEFIISLEKHQISRHQMKLLVEEDIFFLNIFYFFAVY